MKGKLRRGFEFTSLFIEYFIIEMIMIGYCPTQSFFNAPLIGKLGIALIYVGLILLVIFKRAFFWLLLALVLIAAVVIALLMVKDASRGQGKRRYHYKNAYRPTKNPYFDGMSIEEAKKEYKRLLKIYHPDQKTGDLEKTLAVTIAYSQFCGEHGCK